MSTSATVDARKDQIRRIVADILEIDVADLTPTSVFTEDHGADSLRAIEILADLEKTFDVIIDQAELSRMVNLDGVYQVVADTAGWQ